MVAMSLAANAVMAQQAGAGKPQQKFKGPVKGIPNWMNCPGKWSLKNVG